MGERSIIYWKFLLRRLFFIDYTLLKKQNCIPISKTLWNSISAPSAQSQKDRPGPLAQLFEDITLFNVENHWHNTMCIIAFYDFSEFNFIPELKSSKINEIK